jgi:site-specific DNA-methyltransferase (adenine-specific)
MKPYYDRNGITIYCGDCLEIMPQLDLVFDAIICDLPYGTTACSWDTI